MKGQNCRSGCRTKDHASYAECLGTISVVSDTGRAKERAYSADMDAYKRMRKAGLQPPSVAGAAVRERRATTVEQVESRRLPT